MDHLHCYKNESIDEDPCTPLVDSPLIVNCTHYKETCNITRLHNGCVVFNSDGSLKQKGDGESAHLSLRVSDDYGTLKEDDNLWLLLFINHFDELNTRINELGQYYHNPGSYTVYLEKEVYNRLPDPYPSNCSVDGADSDNILNIRYSRRGCYESCGIKRMLNKCEAVLDGFLHYFDKGAPRTVGNASRDNTRQCLSETLTNARFEPPMGCKCPYPCSDVIYKHTTQKFESHEANEWDFYLQYKQRRVTHITETPLMNIAQALANLGGIKGLLIGTSVLSIVEVIVFVGIMISSSIRQFKNFFRKRGVVAIREEQLE